MECTNARRVFGIWTIETCVFSRSSYFKKALVLIVSVSHLCEWSMWIDCSQARILGLFTAWCTCDWGVENARECTRFLISSSHRDHLGDISEQNIFAVHVRRKRVWKIRLWCKLSIWVSKHFWAVMDNWNCCGSSCRRNTDPKCGEQTILSRSMLLDV